jgi:hypothetical protein
MSREAGQRATGHAILCIYSYEGRQQSCKKLLLYIARGCQHLFSARPDADVLGEILPAHGPGTVHKELGRAGYIVPSRPAAHMQQIVAANDLSLGVGEKSEGIACLPAEPGRNIRRIHADSYGQDALRLELLQVLLDASQLEVTERSPVTAIEDQQQRFGLAGAANP